MAIRMMAGAIWAAAATAAVVEQEAQTSDGPTTRPDGEGYRPPRTVRERGGGDARPVQSARPWPSHVLRSATTETDPSCSR
jgi:hypothetical protein